MAGQSPCKDVQRSFNFGWAFIDCEALSRRAKLRMHGRHAPTLEERRACCLAHEMLDDLDEGCADQASRDECENFLHMFCDGKQGRPKVMTARVELAELRDRIVDVVEGFASTIREMKLGHDDEGYNTLFVHILHPDPGPGGKHEARPRRRRRGRAGLHGCARQGRGGAQCHGPKGEARARARRAYGRKYLPILL